MEAHEVVAAVKVFLDEHWDPDDALLAWRRRLLESGWACPTWPVDAYGRGLPPSLAPLVASEFDRVGAVGPAIGAGMTLAAPTILEHATPEQKRRLLGPIVTGEHRWCQLFSEPGNGSDLAGLTTRAERHGDEWVVNGQKVWTTGARRASYGMLLARTDLDVPKHRGLTWFALGMQQPGIDVRPLRQMNGYASFNEVFLTDVRVAHDDAVGGIGNGWRVALTTLSHERGLPVSRPAAVAAPRGRTAREAAEEAADYLATYVWYPQRAGRPDLLAPQLGDRTDDLIARDLVAAVTALDRAARWTAARATAARRDGRSPGAEGSVGKLLGSEIARRSAHAHGMLAGAEALLNGPDSALNGIIGEILLSVPGQSIAGGTDEIQRNILGERVLGLPKEPSVDADVPFREVRTNRR